MAILVLACGEGQEPDQTPEAPDTAAAELNSAAPAQDADVRTDTLVLPAAGTLLDTLYADSDGFAGRFLLLDEMPAPQFKRCGIRERPFDIVNEETGSKLTDSLQFTHNLALRIEYRPIDNTLLIACPDGRSIRLAFSVQQPERRPIPVGTGVPRVVAGSGSSTESFGLTKLILMSLASTMFFAAILLVTGYVFRKRIGDFLRKTLAREPIGSTTSPGLARHSGASVDPGNEPDFPSNRSSSFPDTREKSRVPDLPDPKETERILQRDMGAAIQKEVAPLTSRLGEMQVLIAEAIGHHELLPELRSRIDEVLADTGQLREWFGALSRGGGQTELSSAENKTPGAWSQDALEQPQDDGTTAAAVIDPEVLQRLRELNTEQARQKVAQHCGDFLRRLDLLKQAIEDAGKASESVDREAGPALARLDAIRAWVELQQRGVNAGYMPLVAYVQPNHLDPESVLSRIAADLKASLRIFNNDTGVFDRRIADVLSSALPFLDAANRNRDARDPSWLSALKGAVDLRPFQPSEGDRLLHDQHDPGDDVQGGTIGAVLAPGYFYHNKVLLRARVRRSEGSGLAGGGWVAG